ncbi:hypothetical protein AVEN_236289-1 [Araneus ventricosus]|uniref:Uncharacterized protein n=1 Tax=Araneus ventricosus TaxID=182803 RepID=A0A4Y2QP77_ARAVE|nr:hypothetical protein AVEN_237927-1 [Araneus ventricosus]GBN64979.1 hypothetical protein AVEN_236289-1 [Araneus ventricosus]
MYSLSPLRTTYSWLRAIVASSVPMENATGMKRGSEDAGLSSNGYFVFILRFFCARYLLCSCLVSCWAVRYGIGVLGELGSLALVRVKILGCCCVRL